MLSAADCQGYSCRLEPTAALVMLWSLPLYRDGRAAKLIRELDLSSGERLLRRCNAVCGWYGEAIINRKHFIPRLAGSLAKREKNGAQAILLAAGKSPMALELLELYGDHIYNVIEVDLSGMREKQALYSRLFPELSGRLRCMTGDITDRRLLRSLASSGEKKNLSSVVIMEGITFYITKEGLQNVLKAFVTDDSHNSMVIEYLLPCERVSPARQYIPRDIFGIVKEDRELDKIYSYTPEELEWMFTRAGGAVESVFHMSDMERFRKGQSQYFPASNDGWLECMAGRV